MELQRRTITVAEYHKMREVGILQEDEAIELLNGQIIHMSPKGSKHSNAVRRITRWLYQHLETKAVINVQDPIDLLGMSEPEPDISLLLPPMEQYDLRHPKPKEVFLIIEVSDSSLELDRTEKLAAYASAGIQEYWIVNLPERQIEVYREAIGTAYRHLQLYLPHESIPLFDWGIELPVGEMFPAISS
ncbi:MAG: Uma2 family endonuclease [Bacteroidota bacterium]